MFNSNKGIIASVGQTSNLLGGMLMKVVLLSGHLSRKRLDAFGEQLKIIASKEGFSDEEGITIVIMSEGGDSQKGLKLCEFIKRASFKTHAVIYNASSIAAMIALSCSSREIVRTGELAFHLGNLNISLADIDVSAAGAVNLPNSVNRAVVEMITKTRAAVKDLSIGKQLLHQFSISGVLKLTAPQCEEFGIATIMD